jgi:RimJ/RimL family protein N-acetyltransferase
MPHAIPTARPRTVTTPAPPTCWIESVTTPRLVLRPVAGADLPDLLAVNGDDEVTRFLPYASWQGLEDGQAWLMRMQVMHTSGSGQQLVLQRRSDGRVLGGLLLFKLEAPSARVELGYVLGRAHWGQGLMAEAAMAACTHAFGAMGMRRIEAEVNPANRASNLLLQRLGFVLEGTLRQRWTAKGATYDTHLYGCLPDDWRRAHPLG